MDITTALVQVFQALPPALQGWVLLALLTVFLISHAVLPWTATLPPNTPLGRVYAVLEWVGGLYGKAKDVGIPVPTVTDIVNSLTAHLKSGQPITADNLPQVLGLSVEQPPQRQPQPSPTATMAVALLLVIGLGFGLSACSNAPQTINNGITTANTAVQDASKYLGNACAVLALAHDGFQIASDLSPDVAANKPVEAQVYATLIGPTGLCGPASIANPPSDVGAALKAAYAQIAAFIPNLPQLPAAPASVAPVVTTTN